MVSSPLGSRSKLTPFQSDLLEGFFAREQRFFLTGGAALAGFYFGQRDTDDLDLFIAGSESGVPLEEGQRQLRAAADRCGATLEALRTFPDFRRLLAVRREERCVVDLVVDRAPMVDSAKATFGTIRVDTLREIAANKACAVHGRSEIKDLVDLQTLLASGSSLDQALADASSKDGGVSAASLAWILEQISISPEAALPGGVDPVALNSFRRDLVPRLRRAAFPKG